MWWYGRGNSGGSWLPEEKKANMWYGRGNSGGSWPPAFPAHYTGTFLCIEHAHYCIAEAWSAEGGNPQAP